MIRTWLLFMSALLVNQIGWSDTIGNYQHISQSIPKMEIKADEQAQAWARSARHVLAIANESIAETLTAMNEEATKQGTPFFCLPSNQRLDAQNIGQLIKDSGQDQPSKGNNTTVSQVALAAVVKKYPCKTESKNAFSSLTQTHTAMQHAETTA